jgi:hypothetical protein
MPKNLIVISVFLNRKYVELAHLLLDSIYKYGLGAETTDILIYCGPEFVEEIRAKFPAVIFRTNHSIGSVLAASAARLDIFEFPEVANYEKILYLDTDVLVIRPLAPVFAVATDDLLYALEEGNLESEVPYDYWGSKLFAPGEISALEDKTGFSAGVLLFRNCEAVRALFQKIKEHIARTPGQGFFEQGHMVYNAIKDGLKNATALKPFVVIDEPSVKTRKTILHFAGDVGNGRLKHAKMAMFLRQLGAQQLGAQQLGAQQLGAQQLGAQQLGAQQLGAQHPKVVTSFGSCRVSHVSGNTRISDALTYTHTTKEVLQLIAFMKGELRLQAPYNRICFRAGILQEKGLEWRPQLLNVFEDTEIFVVEVCSRKKYMYGGLCLHDLSVDRRFPGFNKGTPSEIMDGVEIVEQTDDEIRQDLLEIREVLGHRKMIVVSHYNARVSNGEVLAARDELIRLLKGICAENTIPFLDPTEALKDFPQDVVMGADLCHYTGAGMAEFTKKLNEAVAGL